MGWSISTRILTSPPGRLGTFQCASQNTTLAYTRPDLVNPLLGTPKPGTKGHDLWVLGRANQQLKRGLMKPDIS